MQEHETSCKQKRSLHNAAIDRFGDLTCRHDKACTIVGLMPI